MDEIMESITFSFGRLNPPTIGHGKVLDVLKSIAKGGEYRLYLSQTQDKKKNPLSFKDKVKYSRLMFPKHSIYIMNDKSIKTPFDIYVKLYNEGFRDVTMVVGSDRVKSFEKLILQYNGVEAKHGFYEFESVKVVSAGERDPDSDGVDGMSASKMRQSVVDNDFETFKLGVPSEFKGTQKLFDLIKTGMKIKTLKEYYK